MLKKISKPVLLSLITIFILAVIGIVVFVTKVEADKGLEEASNSNIAALNQLFKDKDPLVTKSANNCSKPINPFSRESCQQVNLYIFEGSGDVEKDKNGIRASLSNLGWQADPWKSEGAMFFWEKPKESVKGALAEGSAFRNDGSNEKRMHTGYFKVTFVNELTEDSDALRVAALKVHLSDVELRQLDESNAEYFMVASVDARYQGSY